MKNAYMTFLMGMMFGGMLIAADDDEAAAHWRKFFADFGPNAGVAYPPEAGGKRPKIELPPKATVEAAPVVVHVPSFTADELAYDPEKMAEATSLLYQLENEGWRMNQGEEYYPALVPEAATIEKLRAVIDEANKRLMSRAISPVPENQDLAVATQTHSPYVQSYDQLDLGDLGGAAFDDEGSVSEDTGSDDNPPKAAGAAAGGGSANPVLSEEFSKVIDMWKGDYLGIQDLKTSRRSLLSCLTETRRYMRDGMIQPEVVESYLQKLDAALTASKKFNQRGHNADRKEVWQSIRNTKDLIETLQQQKRLMSRASSSVHEDQGLPVATQTSPPGQSYNQLDMGDFGGAASGGSHSQVADAAAGGGSANPVFSTKLSKVIDMWKGDYRGRKDLEESKEYLNSFLTEVRPYLRNGMIQPEVVESYLQELDSVLAASKKFNKRGHSADRDAIKQSISYVKKRIAAKRQQQQERRTKK